MCFMAAPRATYRIRRQVTVALAIGPDGRLAGLSLHGSGTDDMALDRCMRERLDRLFAGLKPGSRFMLKLTVTMQF